MWLGPVRTGASLVVLEEIATLTHFPVEFEVHVVRRLFNNSSQVHSRWPVRIAVEASPRWSPLSADNPQPGLENVVPEASVHRYLDRERKRDRVEPLTVVLRKDNPTEREFWLEFRDGDYSYPLWPGDEATVEYRYRVSHDCWGNWFQRAIRMPTGRLVIRLDFPDWERLGVYGLIDSTEGRREFQQRIECVAERGRQLHQWSTPFPPIQARYRLAWRS
jgi:hypothetical protein